MPKNVKNVYPNPRSRELEKENTALQKKTREFEKLQRELVDTNTALRKINTERELQNKELVQKTIELTETKNELEDKNYELEAANREILELLKAKTDFINRAAHDLRTPMTPVLTLLPIVKSRITDEKNLHDITIVENNTKYLKQLIDELFSMVKATKMIGYQFEKIAVPVLIDEVIKNEQTVFEMYGIKVIKKIENALPAIFGSGLRLTEVFQNLLTNAIKFMGKQNGAITVSAYKKDTFIYVKISDTGVGMSKETLAKIFEPFYKADKSRHNSGSGLGLSLCRQIIKDHGGQIWAESKGIGKGSTFTFSLPIQQRG